MNKIPVGETIRFAYNFTLSEIGTIIGLIWIPTLINAVASFFVLGSYYQALADSFETGVPPAGPQVMLPFLLALLSMIVLAMVGVAVTQQALGLRKGPAFAHFSLGSSELRVFGGFFGLYMLLVLLVFVFAIVVLGVVAGSADAIKANAGAAALAGGGAGLLGAVGLFAMVYFAARLSFLMIPSAVNEGEFGLTRSWQLTKGNFWRIVAIGLATLAPILVIFGAAEFFILGPAFFMPDVAASNDAATNLHRMAQQMRSVQAHLPLLMGLSFVVSPLMYGLLFAPSAYAYRAISGKITPT
jgi:hypothetical protein